MAEAQVSATSPPKEAPLTKAVPPVATDIPSETASAVLPGTDDPALSQEKVDDPIANVPCPECGFLLKINRSDVALLGRKARCPQCQTKFRLPDFGAREPFPRVGDASQKSIQKHALVAFVNHIQHIAALGVAW